MFGVGCGCCVFFVEVFVLGFPVGWCGDVEALCGVAVCAFVVCL